MSEQQINQNGFGPNNISPVNAGTANFPDFSYDERRRLEFLKRYYEAHLWQKWQKAYEDYLLYTVDRKLIIKGFQSNVKIPLIKTYVDSMWTNIYDTNLQMRVSGRTKEDHKKSDSALQFVEWAMSVSNSYQEFMQCVKEAMICWVGYGKIGFMDHTSEISYTRGKTKINQEIQEQYPYIKYVSVFDIFIDPTSSGLEDSLYVIQRKVMHRKDIVKMYGNFIDDLEKKCEICATNPYYFASYDYSRIKYLAYYNDDYINEVMIGETATSETVSTIQDFTLYYKNYLTVNYEGWWHEVLEYWEDNKLQISIDGSTLYDDENPMPLKKKPFFDLQYNKVPGLAFSHGIATSLGDMQAMADTIMNLWLDNMKLQVAPMFQKQKGWDIFQSKDNVLDFEPFWLIETNTPNAITRLQLGSPDFTWSNVLDTIQKISEAWEWLNSYSLGSQNKIERSATWVSAMVQASKSRLLPLTQSMNHALSKIAQTWIVLGRALMPDEVTLRIFDDNQQAQFKNIDMSDLVGMFDFEFDAQALKTATRETQRKQLMDMIALANQTQPDPTTWLPVVNMKDLWAKLIDTFEMPPQDILTSGKEVLEAQAQHQVDKAKIDNKYRDKIGSYSGQGGQPWSAQQYGQFWQNGTSSGKPSYEWNTQWYGAGLPWINPLPWRGEPQQNEADKQEPMNGPPESQVLKEAYQM